MENIYIKLAEVLNTLPNGFPSTENETEIKILKKIFKPDEAELFCAMRLTFETAEQIASRNNIPLEGLEQKLITMKEKGQIFGVNLRGLWIFKMMPWVFGIYEFQLDHLDRELSELNEQYAPVYGKQFLRHTPQLMQTLPIEEEIPAAQKALPYEKVSTLIETSKAIMAQGCICKKEKGLLDQPCDRPLHVCMGLAPIPGYFDNHPYGRAISKKEAYRLLNECEQNGLVHLTSNVQTGGIYICNCCKCCCGVLRMINEENIPASMVVNSYYYTQIDQEECIECGVCADERCQTNAVIEDENGLYQVDRDRCIGCGLCLSTCPSGAMRLLRKPDNEIVPPPTNEEEWFEQRAQNRGVDFKKYK